MTGGESLAMIRIWGSTFLILCLLNKANGVYSPEGKTAVQHLLQTPVSRYVCMSALIVSVCLSVCPWYVCHRQTVSQWQPCLFRCLPICPGDAIWSDPWLLAQCQLQFWPRRYRPPERQVSLLVCLSVHLSVHPSDPQSVQPPHKTGLFSVLLLTRIRTQYRAGGWCPSGGLDYWSYEWLQIDLQILHRVTIVELQGRFDNGQVTGGTGLYNRW